MGTLGGLERVLSQARGYEHPRIDLEQYPTPAELAARLVHHAALRGDITDRIVVDLGSGPGVLAIGCAFRSPAQIIGIEIDPAAIAISRENVDRLDPPDRIEWIHGDALTPPLRPASIDTILMNPPFGAQRENVHADRAFLERAAELASVSYSFHNAGSRQFIDAFVTDRGGTVTEAFAATFDLARQYTFHDADVVEIDVECYRIEWRETN